MEIVDFLEEVAILPHFDNRIKDFLAKLTPEIQEAFISNNFILIKRLLSDSAFIADPSDVVQIKYEHSN